MMVDSKAASVRCIGRQWLRTHELAQAPLRGDVPEAQRAVRGADEQRVEARRVAAQAGDAVRVGQRRHERLREHAVELDGVQGAGVLDGLLERVQRRVQIPVHLGLLGSGSRLCIRAFITRDDTGESSACPPIIRAGVSQHRQRPFRQG